MGFIRVVLQSDLCAGNGRSVGNLIDTDCCMDTFGFPVIPARRLKGCLRQAAEQLREIGYLKETDVIALFGDGNDNSGSLQIQNARIEQEQEMCAWLHSKAVPQVLKASASPENIGRLFTAVRGQTRMVEGVVDKGSLRYTRVLGRMNPITGEPLCLIAKVDLKKPDLTDALKKCCMAVRHIGTNRNRGLGFVRLTYCDGIDEQRENRSLIQKSDPDQEGKVIMHYRIGLDANLIMNGISETLAYIPGRSVIGCMSANYIQKQADGKTGGELDTWLRRDRKFQKLFLSGEVVWSDLTPVIAGKRSEPTPLMLTHLKNADAYCNPFCDAVPQREKLKTLEGTWAAGREDGYTVGKIETEMNYHHRHENTLGQEALLYSQNSICSNLLFEGMIKAPEPDVPLIEGILETASLRFGQSRNAQYATCHLVEMPEIKDDLSETTVLKGETVYVLLAANMLLQHDGLYVSDTEDARRKISAELGLVNRIPDGQMDYVQFGAIGGYHAKWHMQKMQLPVIRGGSVFCFSAPENRILPCCSQMGDLQQEGLGIYRILSQRDMKALHKVCKGDVMTEKIDSEESSVTQAFRNALLMQAASFAVSESALQIFAKRIRPSDHLMRNLNNGRIRLMLEESQSLEELITRVAEIKREKPRKAGLELLREIYFSGGNSREKSVESQAEFAMENLLRSIFPFDTELADYVIGMDDTLKNRVWCENWKRVMFIVLHLHDYENKRRRTGKVEADL